MNKKEHIFHLRLGNVICLQYLLFNILFISVLCGCIIFNSKNYRIDTALLNSGLQVKLEIFARVNFVQSQIIVKIIQTNNCAVAKMCDAVFKRIALLFHKMPSCGEVVVSSRFQVPMSTGNEQSFFPKQWFLYDNHILTMKSCVIKLS